MPEGWAWCRLPSICRKAITDGTHNSPTTYDKGDFLYITAKNIKADKIDLTNVSYVTKEIHEEIYNRCPPELNDVLLTKDGTIGEVAVNNLQKPFSLLSSVALIKPANNIKPWFIAYVLKSNYLQSMMHQSAKGVALKRIILEQINTFLIPLPPFAEQERIVSSIENIFAQINNLEESKSDLESVIKQAKSKILDLAIHGKLVPQDPNDEPAEELLKRIATSDNRPYEKVDSSEIDWSLPNNWCLCHFGDIATVINGKNQSKVENPNGQYPIYGSGGIIGRADDFICPENCTIIGRKGSINNPIFVEEKFWNVDTAFGLCPSEAILPKFLFYFCEYFDFTTLDSSTTLPSLTKTNIQQIILTLPPIEEQKRILDKTFELFGKLDEIVLNLL